MNGQQAAFVFQKIQQDIHGLEERIGNLTDRLEDLVQLLAPLLRPSGNVSLTSNVVEASNEGNFN